jgi:hypothetical protein
MVFVTIASIVSSTKITRKGKKHVGIGVRLTFITKYFHKWKMTRTFYKCIKLGPQENDVVPH